LSVLGIGIDVVEVERISLLLGQHPERFLARCFRPGDAKISHPEAADFSSRVAGGWAAKEALLKALGGDPSGVPYRDIELVRGPAGELTIKLYGLAADMGAKRGVGSIRVSISETSCAALAQVVLLA
jgi:holo-[acyl-carrier protein] synthase